jgi:signal transduction histidine kinase
VKSKIKESIKYFLVGLIGVCVPVFYAYLDMWELEIETNWQNIVDMLRSQNIYIFSAGFFPFIFVIVGHLIIKINQKNNMLVSDFEYLKVVLNATPDAIVFLNEEKEIVFQNNQFRLLFDDFQAILEKTHFNEFFDQVEYIQKEIVIDSNIIVDHPFLMSFKLTKYNDRRNFFVSFKDLKSLKDKERIIEDQKHQMIEKNKLASLGEMAAGIAHEVNNPLTVIHSNNTIIKKLYDSGKMTPERITKLTDKTKDQIVRITEIITSLRNLSRGMANEEIENFAVHQVLSEALKLARIRNKSSNIEYIYSPTTLHTFANRGQIVQVILNLLNNAIDAVENDDSPWIKFETQENDSCVDIFITDSGSGISSNNLKKIFVPMYTTKDVGKGTGLGLSLSRTFVEQNGGTLDYMQVKGHTCFKIKLPKNTNTDKLIA